MATPQLVAEVDQHGRLGPELGDGRERRPRVLPAEERRDDALVRAGGDRQELSSPCTIPRTIDWNRSTARARLAVRADPRARSTRFSPSVFRLPVEKIRDGYHSDAYFNHTKALLEADDRHPHVVMQVFQRKDVGARRDRRGDRRPQAVRGSRGEDGRWVHAFKELEVNALLRGRRDLAVGDRHDDRGRLLRLLLYHLEAVYLGCVARRTLIMRNVHEVVEAANGKPILYFPARHDHWLVQTGDGWAAHVAGAIGVSTDAQASWWGGRGVGTVPHGLIAAYGGDTALASDESSRTGSRHDMNVTVLVDFENHSVNTALAAADALGGDLWGVRLDTSDQTFGHDSSLRH